MGGLFLFFDAAVLFLDPLTDDLRPGELFRFAALVQLFQRQFPAFNEKGGDNYNSVSYKVTVPPSNIITYYCKLSN